MGVHIEQVEFRENGFPQRQRKVSVTTRCSFEAGVHKTGLDCTEFVK